MLYKVIIFVKLKERNATVTAKPHLCVPSPPTPTAPRLYQLPPVGLKSPHPPSSHTPNPQTARITPPASPVNRPPSAKFDTTSTTARDSESTP